MDESRIAGLEASMTMFRGVVMVVAALLASMFPREAFRFVLLAGGVLLLADGMLSIASAGFSGRRHGAFWLDCIRSLLCISAGLALLAKHIYRDLFMVGPVGFLAAGVGGMIALAGFCEILAAVSERERHANLVSATLGGGLYIIFGIMLMFVPLGEGATLIRIAAILVLLYVPTLFYRAWRAWPGSSY
ncbi:DUF308 domain-containing protein [Mesorhizobium xinjiangense]|uniref:DUF308 domain-containing protein n=1 Tax=Mesorhizobium xinjiangense TaxID=2678685 RepID=UPI0012ECD871|nr:DUF308 domain-containing protein [Mesorhizobium xinjiangense]